MPAVTVGLTEFLLIHADKFNVISISQKPRGHVFGLLGQERGGNVNNDKLLAAKFRQGNCPGPRKRTAKRTNRRNEKRPRADTTEEEFSG